MRTGNFARSASRCFDLTLVALGLAIGLLSGFDADAADTWSDPFTGVRRLHRQTADQNIHALVVDLCQPGVAIRATAHAERGQTTAEWASAVGLQAAVNGDFCNVCGPGDYVPAGLAMSSAELWPGTGDTPFEGFLAAGFGQVALSVYRDTAAPEAWMREIVGGRPTILESGAILTEWPENESLGDLCNARHPRTAVGLSADRRTFFMAVVDGRAPGRAGMTCPELASFLLEIGASDALNMDGGGSSAMWLQGAGIVNNPSDGSLRTLTNHVGLYATGSGYDWSHCPPYAASFVDQSFPYAHLEALSLAVGESEDGWIEMKNIGRETWEPGVTKLAPTPRDVASPFHDPSWLSSIRISSVTSPVPPLSTARFTVRLTASASGEFLQTFGFVQEAVTWFADPPLGGGPPDDLLSVRVNVSPAPDAAVDAPADMPADTAADDGYADAPVPDLTDEEGPMPDAPADDAEDGAADDAARDDAPDDAPDDAAAADGGCACAVAA